MKKDYRPKIVFHFSKLMMAGTLKATYFLVQLLHKTHNIEIVYNDTADTKLLAELLEYVPVNKLHDKIKVDKCIKVTYYDDDALVDADEKYQWIHSAIKDNNSPISERNDIKGYIGVSNFGKRQIDEHLNVDSIVIYNEIDKEIHSKADEYLIEDKAELKLVSINRLSEEKGFDDMLIMAKALKNKKIDFKWYIIGSNNYKTAIEDIHNMFTDIPEVVFVGDVVNPYPYIKWADYLVAPSKRETWHLGVNESLALNTPVITTDIAVFHEQVIHGENGYMFNVGMGDFNVEKVLNVPKFEYKEISNYQKWYEIIEEPASYTPEKYGVALVKAYLYFYDKENNVYRNKDEEWEVSLDRAIELKIASAPVDIIKLVPRKDKFS